MIKDTCRLGQITVMFGEKEARPSLTIVPADMEGQVIPEKAASMSAMAQLHVRGDGHETPYSKGLTMLGSKTAASMRLTERRQKGDAVRTVLTGDHGLRYTQTLTACGRCLTVEAALENTGDAPVVIDHAATFCLAGMTPFEAGFAPDCMTLHRFSSFWSCEGRLQSQTVEELNMETSWSRWATKSVRIGQAGTMPVRGWFPLMALEDTRRGVTWAAEVAWAGSWNMELFRQKEDLVLTGGLASFEDGHFRKTLAPGERLQLPKAALTVVRGGLDEACEALLDAHKAALRLTGEAEKTLNPMYNEYCDTWGKPTAQTVRDELRAVRGLGLSYFVIDAGWYGQVAEWGQCTGDWDVRRTAFPEGLKPITDEIRAAGMIPGLWFEAEVASDQSQVFRDQPEMFVTDGGKPIVETDRAFLNLTREDAHRHLRERVIDRLREDGFGYIKVDYNNTYGLGFDGFESMGEAQRNGVLGTYRFFEEMRRQLPDLVIENCSSGGHRLELSMMSRCDMASFSDAHECPEIPLVAADLTRLILPRQSQIWSVVRRDDSLRRIIWSLSATLLGRMCLSGPLHLLGEDQMQAIRDGVAFYRKAAPIIAEGSTRIYRQDITAYDHAHGWQATVRRGEAGLLVTAHAFEHNGGAYTLPCDVSGWSIDDVYAAEGCGAAIENGRLVFRVNGDYCGMGVLLTRR